MESLMIVLGLLAVPYFVLELWWTPRQDEKMRRKHEKRGLAALDKWLRDKAEKPEE